MLHLCRYHGDDGHAFSGRGTGRAYGPTYTTGRAYLCCCLLAPLLLLAVQGCRLLPLPQGLLLRPGVPQDMSACQARVALPRCSQATGLA